MDVNLSFKPTELGTLPADWNVTEIGALRPFVTSGSRGWAEYYSEYGASFMRITNLSRSTIYLELDDIRYVDVPLENAEAVRTELQNGDMLVSITADIGIVGYISERVPKPSFINQHIALVRFDRSRVNSKFVSYFLASKEPQKRFRALTDAGAKAGMNLTTVQQVKIALPPTLAEQEAIAEALSDADALIESLEQLLAKKRHIKQGAMQELLTGKKRLPGFSGAWEVRRLGDLGRWTGGMTPSMANPAFWQDSSVPWISSGDVKSRRLSNTAFSVSELAIKQKATTLIPPHSIVVVTRSGILRKYLPVATNVVPMAINQDIKALIPTDCAETSYLLHILDFSGDEILARCLKAGTTVESVEFRWLKAFTIPVPPLLEQTAIATILSDMDAEITALEAKLTKARAIKQGMMQELLTGRIRLI